jgi:AcrR family transcriptional regulator
VLSTFGASNLENEIAIKRGKAANRIVQEAARLFSEKGYERTTVADIQAACGLNPGSGALYKHFPSKEAVLRAVLDNFVGEFAEVNNAFSSVTLPSKDALENLARQALAMLAKDRDILRIIWRDLDPFPKLRAKVRDERIQESYIALGKWLKNGVTKGSLSIKDPEATAVAMLASVITFKLLEAFFGETPARISEDRFVQAWLALVSNGIFADEQ